LDDDDNTFLKAAILGTVDQSQIFIVSSRLLPQLKVHTVVPYLNLDARLRDTGSFLEAPGRTTGSHEQIWEFIRVGKNYILLNWKTLKYIKYVGTSNFVLSSVCDYSLDYTWDFQYQGVYVNKEFYY